MLKGNIPSSSMSPVSPSHTIIEGVGLAIGLSSTINSTVVSSKQGPSGAEDVAFVTRIVMV
ncbi:hypothetical protein [Algibacter lectus]|nr:hypothetical protein [Algibacter lectus]